MDTTKRAVAPAGFPPLRYDLAEQAERASKADGPWSLRHLRVPAIATAALLIPGVVLALTFRGLPAVWGVVLGLVVVAFFFWISSWVVARAGEIDPSFTMAAALITYGLKIVILGLLLAAVPLDGPIDRIWLGSAIAVGLVVWLGSQVWVTIRTPRMYVDTSAQVSPNGVANGLSDTADAAGAQ